MCKLTIIINYIYIQKTYVGTSMKQQHTKPLLLLFFLNVQLGSGRVFTSFLLARCVISSLVLRTKQHALDKRLDTQQTKEDNAKDDLRIVKVRHQDWHLSIPAIDGIFQITIICRNDTLRQQNQNQQRVLCDKGQRHGHCLDRSTLEKDDCAVYQESNQNEIGPSVDKLYGATRLVGGNASIFARFTVLFFIDSSKELVPAGYAGRRKK